MKRLLCSVLVAALAGGAASTVQAQTQNLQMTMKDGRVTILARDVPLRALFDEWARIGQTSIVNADKLTGPRVTLQLVDTTESAALDVLLRSAAGYIAAPRPGNRPGPSAYDRITILATASHPPAAPASAATRGPLSNRAAAAIAIPVAVNDDTDAPADAGSQDVADRIPEQQPAVASFPELQPQLEGAQPPNLDRNGLMQNPQGQSVAPGSTPTGVPPGQPIPRRYPMFPRPPGGDE